MARTSRHRPGPDRAPALNVIAAVVALLAVAVAIWITATFVSRSLSRQALGGRWVRSDGLELVFYLLDKPRLVVSYPRVEWGDSVRNIRLAVGPDGSSAGVTGTIEFSGAPCLGTGQTATLSSFNAKDADSDQDVMGADFPGIKLGSGRGGAITVDATGGTMTVLQRLKPAIARPEDAVLSASGPIGGQPLHLELKRTGKQLTVRGGIEGEFAKAKE